MPLPSAQSMLAELVAIPSVSCTQASLDQSNLPVLETMAGWLHDLKFDVQITPLADNDRKGNLIATLGGSAEAPSGLLLAGHSDTVPFDAQYWQSDPFTLGRPSGADEHLLYGLGSADMKGFLALMVKAAETYAQRDMKAPLTLLVTADEESSMAGARQVQQEGTLRAQRAVIGEPTGLVPVYAHKGMIMMAVRVRGKSGHSSNPELGTNALEAMHGVMSELLAFRNDLQQRHSDPAFAVSQPTMNLGCIHGGDNPNRICGETELQIDIRLLPGMDSHNVITDLTRQLEACSNRYGTDFSFELFYPPIEPFQGDANGDLARTAAHLTGNAPETVAFGTEGPFMQSLGAETIIMGPGSIDQAHQPNEYIDVRDFEPTVDMLGALIRRYCINAEINAEIDAEIDADVDRHPIPD